MTGLISQRRYPHGRGVALFPRTLVSDTFTRADSATSLGTAESGQAWTAQSGTWGIASGKARLVTSTSQATAVVNAGAADVSVICDITAHSGSGVVVRAIDDSNYLLLALDVASNTVALLKRDAGAFTTLASQSTAGLVDATTYAVRFVAAGADVRGYVNGTQRVQSTLSGADLTKFGTPTKAGLRSHADITARFENFRVSV